MANVKITVEGVLMDGHQVSFKAPCDCTAIDKLDVYYVENMVVKNKLFTMKDAHGNDLTGIGNLFAKGAIVKVILDTVNSAAYIQNAATNSYIEGRFNSMKNIYYGTGEPSADLGNDGDLYFQYEEE